MVAEDGSQAALNGGTATVAAGGLSATVALAGRTDSSITIRGAVESLTGETVHVTGAGTAASPWIITFISPAQAISRSWARRDTGLQRSQSVVSTVTDGAGAAKEIQTITVSGADDGVLAGEFRLTMDGITLTPAIPYNATAQQVKDAVKTLTTLPVSVSGPRAARGRSLLGRSSPVT